MAFVISGHYVLYIPIEKYNVLSDFVWDFLGSLFGFFFVGLIWRRVLVVDFFSFIYQSVS